MSSPTTIPQTRILIDSNVYFRLAQSIHPLLRQEFGANRYCLYIIDGFDSEYVKNSRLNSTFGWVELKEYVENRSQKINRSKKEKEEVRFNLEYLKETAIDLELTTSPTDIDALALAMVLDIYIVTDDSDMLKLAAEFDIKTYKTVELLKLMFDANHIDNVKIDSITSYLSYSNDLPKDFAKDFINIFGRNPKL